MMELGCRFENRLGKCEANFSPSVIEGGELEAFSGVSVTCVFPAQDDSASSLLNTLNRFNL